MFGLLAEAVRAYERLELGRLEGAARRLLDLLHHSLLHVLLHILVIGLLLETRLAFVRIELLRLETTQ
jgi:hypothetical protein